MGFGVLLRFSSYELVCDFGVGSVLLLVSRNLLCGCRYSLCDEAGFAGACHVWVWMLWMLLLVWG